MEKCVGPILQQHIVALNQRSNFTDMKIRQLQEEHKRTLMRISWIEKDMLTLQTDLARRQLVIRNWPPWMSADERHENVRCLCEKADIDNRDSDVQTATPPRTAHTPRTTATPKLKANSRTSCARSP